LIYLRFLSAKLPIDEYLLSVKYDFSAMKTCRMWPIMCIIANNEFAGCKVCTISRFRSWRQKAEISVYMITLVWPNGGVIEKEAGGIGMKVPLRCDFQLYSSSDQDSQSSSCCVVLSCCVASYCVTPYR